MADLNFSHRYNLNTYICPHKITFSGFVMWFDVEFSFHNLAQLDKVLLTNSPFAPITHWKH